MRRRDYNTIRNSSLKINSRYNQQLHTREAVSRAHLSSSDGGLELCAQITCAAVLPHRRIAHGEAVLRRAANPISSTLYTTRTLQYSKVTYFVSKFAFACNDLRQRDRHVRRVVRRAAARARVRRVAGRRPLANRRCRASAPATCDK